MQPLVITGGYAVQAHQLVDRPSRDLDVATDSDIPMKDIVTAVVAGLTARGWDIHIIGVDPRSARMMATDPATGEQCEMDILKEVFCRHAWYEQFSLSELKARLDGAEWYDDQAFTEYGLSAEQITDLRRWAQAWADDIVRRISAETYEEEDDDGESL
jgi:hypothetical protein